jgi:hypothetical protein
MTLTAERMHQVLGHRTDVIESLIEIHKRSLTAVEPRFVELASQRIAELLGESSRSDLGELTGAEQACLAFVEQWVIDVSSMTDELVADVARHLGDNGLLDFAHAVLVAEQRIRLSVAWRQLGLGV